MRPNALTFASLPPTTRYTGYSQEMPQCLLNLPLARNDFLNSSVDYLCQLAWSQDIIDQPGDLHFSPCLYSLG